MNRIPRFWRKALPLLSLIALTAATLLIAEGSDDSTEAAEPTPLSWPQMQMTYEETGSFRGLSQPPETKVWRLSYQGMTDWKKELVASSVDPRAVGDVYRYDGSAFIADQARTEDDIVRPSDGPVAPDSWLMPGRHLNLEQQGYAMFEEPALNQVRYVQSQVINCQADPTNQATGVSQPATCATAPTYERRETFIYRTDVVPPVPVEVISEINGIVIGRIVVTKLTVVIGGVDVQLIQ